MRKCSILHREITESEKRTDLKFKTVDAKFDAVHARIDEMDKRLVDLRNIVIALITVIVIPTAALTYAARKFAAVTSATKELSQMVKDNAEGTNTISK